MGKDNKIFFQIALLLVFLFFSVSSSPAESKVTSLTLERKGDFTYFTIYSDSVLEFSHSGEPPKEGKPDRLVIDCHNTAHQLGRKNFKVLPSKTITAIRTSQYQEVPQKIVRIVLDLKKPVVYKLVAEKEKNKITFAISTPEDEPFALWSIDSEKIPATHPASEENKSPEYTAIPSEKSPLALEKTQTELKSVPKASTAPEEKPEQANVKNVVKESESSKPETKRLAVDPQSSLEERLKPYRTEKIAEQENLVTVKKSEDVASSEIKEGKTASKTEVSPDKPKTTKEKSKETKTALAVKTDEPEETVAKADFLRQEESKVKAVEKAEASKDLKKAEEPNQVVSTKEAKKEKSLSEPVAQSEKSKTTEEKKISQASFSFPEKKIETAVAVGTKLKTKSPEKPSAKTEEKVVLASKEKTLIPSASVQKEKGEEPAEEAPETDTMLAVADTSVEEGKIKLGTTPQRKVLAYESNGRRDPFVPLTEKISFEFGETPIPNVENLQLVGIMEDDAGIRALLEDEQGYGYIMMVGDKVKNGQVVHIAKDKIVFQIEEYGWMRTVTLELSTEKEARKKS